MAAKRAMLKKWTKPLLCRDFIHNMLYNKANGYFADEVREVVHSPTNPIDFKNLWGKWEYKSTLQRLYKEEKEAWLTPAEVFAPWYSQAIAKYMLSLPMHPLCVYEIGGGSGANASHILDYIATHAPDVYETMQYNLIEISPRLAERQRKRMEHHSDVCKVECLDMLTWKSQVTKQCFVIALEVLDNLPHDKLVLQDGQWHQTMVDLDGSGDFLEKTDPLEDPLIRETLRYFPPKLPLQVQYKYNSPLIQKLRSKVVEERILTSAFVPTGCMQLLNVLRQYFPHHRLIAADFDQLPPPTLSKDTKHPVYGHPKSPTSTRSGPLHSANAPLVASKVSGETLDHDTYLIGDGSVDVFFSTDFPALKRAYCKRFDKASQQVSIVKSSNFMESFAEKEQTKTISGYNPLIKDYENTSFILS